MSLKLADVLIKPNGVVVLASVGIAVHHAGLNTEDRRTVEDLYLRKALSVLVSTSVRNYAIGVYCSHCFADSGCWR